MNRDDILRMAREAGFEVHDRKQQARVGMDALLGIDSTDKLERFHALAVERERAARQSAQAENEELKARLARAGVEQRRAVRDERKACLEIADQCADSDMHASMVANCIRAREGLDAPNLRPKGTYTINCPTVSRSDQQTPTLVTPGNAGDVLGRDGQWVPTITHVAIRYNGNVYTMPAPYRHHDVIRMIGGIAGPDVQGFMTNRGDFLTRTEAMKVAVAAGQLKRGPGGYQGPELFSEDLW